MSDDEVKICELTCPRCAARIQSLALPLIRCPKCGEHIETDFPRPPGSNDEKRIEIARTIVQERSRFAVSEQWKAPLIEQMKVVRSLKAAKAIARQLHCEGWPPDETPRRCGCIGCRAYAVLNNE